MQLANHGNTSNDVFSVQTKRSRCNRSTMSKDRSKEGIINYCVWISMVRRYILKSRCLGIFRIRSHTQKHQPCLVSSTVGYSPYWCHLCWWVVPIILLVKPRGWPWPQPHKWDRAAGCSLDLITSMGRCLWRPRRYCRVTLQGCQ